MSDAFCAASAFEKFRAALPRRFGDNVVASWLCDLEFEKRTDDAVVLSTESQLRCDTIGQRFLLLLKEAWSEEVFPIRRLKIDVRRRLERHARRALTPPVNGATPAGRPLGLAAARAAAATQSEGVIAYLPPIDDRQTFDSFAVDESNELAFGAARRVFAEGAADEAIYLYGPSGVGKTHVLMGAANEAAKLYGPQACAYLTYSAWRELCVNAVWSHTVPGLHRELLARQVILVDDVHLLASSRRTQSELVELLKAALTRRIRIVVAGELPPAELAAAGVSQRLANWLAGALRAPIEPGGAALRARVIRKRIELKKPRCDVGDDAVAFIAENFSQSLREALGAFDQLLYQYGERAMQVGRIEAALALNPRIVDSRPSPTLEQVALATAAAHNISIDELKGRGQYQRLARARHAFVMVARESLKESFPRIARTLNRDHTTAMSGFRRAEALRVRDTKFAALVASIRQMVGCA